VIPVLSLSVCVCRTHCGHAAFLTNINITTWKRNFGGRERRESRLLCPLLYCLFCETLQPNLALGRLAFEVSRLHTLTHLVWLLRTKWSHHRRDRYLHNTQFEPAIPAIRCLKTFAPDLTATRIRPHLHYHKNNSKNKFFGLVPSYYLLYCVWVLNVIVTVHNLYGVTVHQAWIFSSTTVRTSDFQPCVRRDWRKPQKVSEVVISDVRFIIIIFINYNWVVTRWQWLFYMYTKYEIGYC